MKEQSKTLVVKLMPLVLMLFSFAVIYTAFKIAGVELAPILSVVIALTPIWLPSILFLITYEMWMWSVQEKFKFNTGRTTLRIKLPQEVLKSPEAMESVLSQIHNPGRPDNYMQTYLDGRHRLVYSFEIVSIGGEVRFYVNVPTQKTKNHIESQLYAQYPGIEVVEEEVDYTAEVKWDPKKWDMISFHILKKKDEVMPIKTYIDYGLDKQPKEELKFEPMSPLIEHLGTVKPHERIWIQFLCVPHEIKTFKRGYLNSAPTWEKKANAKINELMKRDQEGLGAEETESRPVLTMSERDTIASIERNSSKYAYDTVVRAMYITEEGKFDGNMISPMLRGFSQYDMLGRNQVGVVWRTDFDYNFWQDFSGRRKTQMKKTELEYYKARFYLPGDKKRRSDAMKVMSVEELATMYHIPGTSVLTPALTRVESVRKEAPANLPIAPQN